MTKAIHSSCSRTVFKKHYLRRRLLRHGRVLQHLDPLPGVVLPAKDGLVVQELCALTVDDLLPEGLVLEELKEVQADRVLDEANVLGLLER